MKLKYPIKNPVTATNFCLMLLPLLFILLEILKINSEDLRFNIHFLLAVCLIPIYIIPTFIEDIFNLDTNIVITPLEFIWENKYTSLIIFILLFILGITALILYSKNKIKAYKIIAIPITAIWLPVILIHCFTFIIFIFAYIASEIEMEILAFLAALVCFAIFLPIYIIAVITVDKTFSAISSGQPKEEKNETEIPD